MAGGLHRNEGTGGAGAAPGEMPAPAVSTGNATPPVIELLATWTRRVLEGAIDPAVDSPGDGGWLSTALPFSFTYGGRSSTDLLGGWTRSAETHETADGRTVRTLRLQDPVSGLVVVWEATTYADHPAVAWLLTLRNEGAADTPIIEHLRALDLTLATDCYDLVVHYALGGHATPDAFAPQVRCLRSEPAGPFRLASVGGRSSNGVLPYFNVEANWDSPRGLVVAIGWSGQWEAQLTRSRSAPPKDIEPDLRGPNPQVSAFRSLDRLRIEAGMEGVHTLLHPGEAIRTPRILLLPWQGNRRHGQNALRRFLHQTVAPKEHRRPPLPAMWCSLGIADPSGATLAAGYTHMGLAQLGAQLPVDYVLIDAGWYESPVWSEGVGNYAVRKDIFPDGLRPISQAVRAAGKGFGLWFEPERVYEGTEVFSQHRGWLFPEKLAGRGKSYVLNMGNPEARRWVTDTVSRLIEEIGIDWYRHDANANYLPVWRANDPPDRQGISEIRHIEGLYRFWQDLMERHPGLYMEGCSSGGRRMDFEALRYHHSYFFTDWMVGDPAGMQSIVHAASQWLPGIYMNNVMSHTSAAVEDTVERRYAFWSALGGGLMYGWRVFNDRRPMDMDLARRWIGEFRALRHLAVGDFYPLQPHTNSEGEWLASQYDRPDLGEGILVAFRRRHCAEDSLCLRPRAIDPDATYTLEYQSTRATVECLGRDLAAGLTITLHHAPAHEVVRYRRR
ncbi:MAG: alpha-galactosidase [Chloroflexi bacterium]|nr:alpha-galactosidase [Chloroflexota bacterium]